MGTSGGTPASVLPVSSSLLTVGQEAFRREDKVSSVVAQASGAIRLSFFTARKSETTTQTRVYTGGTGAGATPTLCRIGLWTVDASDNGTLVASTPNDTALFSGTVTAYTKAWSTPYAMVAGQRYAWGVLVISGATMPTWCGDAGGAPAEWGVAPRISGLLSGLSDLGNFVVGSLAAAGFRVYGAILP